MDKSLGIIGGMGPLATVELFEKIVLLTDAKSDQEHINILIHNNTAIPDRTTYILQGGNDPKVELIKSAQTLENMGADYLIMPCNTAHYFYNDIIKEINIPFLNMIEETAKEIINRKLGIRKIGLLSTEGTAKANIYDGVFENHGLEIVKLSKENQKHITDLIYNIKKGIHQENLIGYYEAIDELKDQGVELFILGCTELSVALTLYDLKGNYIDPLEVIAKRAIEFAGRTVKE